MATESEQRIIRAAFALIEGGSIEALMDAVKAHQECTPRRFVDCDGDVWTERENGLFSLEGPGKQPLETLREWYSPLTRVTDDR